MSTQELEQQVCQKFGWSARFFVVESDDESSNGCWAVEVRRGLHDDAMIFVSKDRSDRSIKGIKQGKKAASMVALEGLQQEISHEMAKPIVSSLDQAVGHLFGGREILESSEKSWATFWSSKPKVVGIDTEGNKKSPPVLVQIATDDMVILEAPRGSISSELKRLLLDDSVVKVFCDNGSHHDKKSLGLTVDPTIDNMVSGPIVDLEIIAADVLGPVKVGRGLAKLISLTMPEVSVRIQKQDSGRKSRLKDVGKFTTIEQGLRPPLRGVGDVTAKEQRYAALDAWCTLQIWKRLMSKANISEIE